MKKILTAEMQWRNAINDTHANFGEFRNIEDHKIVDDGIGIIGDNCMYRFSDERCDYFFIKVGNTYKSIYVELSKEHLLADNWLKLDPQDAWYDKGKVFEWILQTHKECDISLEAPIQLYELIWMGIYNEKQVTITEYKTEYVETTYDFLYNVFQEITDKMNFKTFDEIVETFSNGEVTHNDDSDYLNFEYKGFKFIVEQWQSGDQNVIALSESAYDTVSKVEYLVQDGMRNILPKEIHIEVFNLSDEDKKLADDWTTRMNDVKKEIIEKICSFYTSQCHEFIGIDMKVWSESKHYHFCDYNLIDFKFYIGGNAETNLKVVNNEDEYWESLEDLSVEELLYVFKCLLDK